MMKDRLIFGDLPIGSDFSQARGQFKKIESQPGSMSCSGCETGAEAVWNAYNGTNRVHFCHWETVTPVARGGD